MPRQTVRRRKGEGMSNLAEAFPAEQERVRELLVEYEKIGPSGAFGAMMLRQVLKEADAASMSGDVVRMLRAYEAMKECE